MVVQSGAGGLDGCVEFLTEEFAGWEGREVFGDVDAGLAEFEQFDLLFLLTGTKDEAEGRFFAGLLLVFRQPAEVEFHLAFVLGLEVTEFELYGDQTP